MRKSASVISGILALSLVASSFADLPPGTYVISVDPAGSFLNSYEPQDPATRFDLPPNVSAGTLINLQELGTYQRGPGLSLTTDMNGVFVDASGNFLSPGPLSTVAPIVTAVAENGLPTDIPQDFSIPSTAPAIAQVPQGAVAILFMPNDLLLYDNTDPDGDYAAEVMITVGPDLAVGTPQVSQPNSVTNPDDGFLQVAPNVPAQVVIPISGSGFTSSETGSTTVTLQAGSQPLQSQTISLADIQSGAVTSVTFNVTFDPSLAGTTQTITATIDPGNALNESNFSNNTASVQVDVVGKPSLSIVANSVIVTQAVNNFTLSGQSDVALVQKKSAAIIATVTVASPIPNDQTPMTVVATMPDGTTVTSSPIPMASIDPDDGVEVTIFPGPVNSSGQGTISLQANAADAISSVSVPQTVVVKATNPLGIVYVPLSSDCGVASASCSGTLRNPQQHMDESTSFIQDTFPIADAEVTSQLTSEQSISVLPSGIFWDLEKVLLIRTISNPFARNGIGIVPSDPSGASGVGYFAAHGQPGSTRGYTEALDQIYLAGLPTSIAAAINPGISLVSEGFWTTTAHEIGHTFGVPDNNSDSPEGVYAVGYDVANQRLLEDDSGDLESYTYDFMATISSPSAFQNLANRWISSLAYGIIFQASLTDPLDPQVMIISGIQQSNGSITLDSSYLASSGVATPYVASAKNSVNVLNSQGAIVSQASFADATQLQMVTDQGVISTPSAVPFVVQVPFSSGASTIQFTHNGASVLSFDPNSKLLLDAINNISDSSFVKNPTKTRDVLETEAKGLEQIMALCQSEVSARDPFGRKICSRVIIDGLYGLRGEIALWLNDSTTKTSPLQMDQADVLHTIDRLILYLMPTSLTIQQTGQSIDIDVVMDPDQCGSKLFRVTQVTQGEYGSVSIDRDETSVRYSPKSRKPIADQFSYTITDPEGDQVIGTVYLTVPQPPKLPGR